MRTPQGWVTQSYMVFRPGALLRDTVSRCNLFMLHPLKERQLHYSSCGGALQAGFLSAGKKGSIFAVPDNPHAKVGVVGSGKGMTDYKTSNRHDFAAD